MSERLHLIIFYFVLITSVCGSVVKGDPDNHPNKATQVSYSPTEILYIENGFPLQRTYKLEDFFWTGSGDGAPEIQNTDPWAETEYKPTTVYRTTTLMSTVYISIMTVTDNQNTTSTSPECTLDCETVTVSHSEDISPTPTISKEEATATPYFPPINTTDRQFWLLTVLRTNNDTEPRITILEQQLAKLYSTAFRRQQEKHLGIAKRTRRHIPPPNGKPVNVHIYNVSKLDNNQVEVLYHVLVSGQPVAAVTAATDMKLVSDEEVVKEIGYSVVKKAEPFLRINRPQRLARTRDTWLFVGVVLATILLLVVTVTSFTLCLKKKVPPENRTGLTNRQRIFEQESGEGRVNEGFVEKDGDGKSYHSGKRHKRPMDTLSSGAYKKGISISSPSNSSITSTSSSSLSCTPVPSPRPLMVTPKPYTHKKKHKPPPKRASAINKTLVQERQKQEQRKKLEEDSDSDRKSSGNVKENGKISPKSYLSMPSVKSFPRSSIPETLNRVLEPVSVLHLDMHDDGTMDQFSTTTDDYGSRATSAHASQLARHASMGGEDPGVIGPVVWDMHCKRMQQDIGVDEPDDIKSMTRMRKRFNELVDDTFTLFGSTGSGRNSSQGDWETGASQTTKCVDTRGHSATNVRLISEGNQPMIKPRPKTSDSRRVAPSPGVDPPRQGAWGSGVPSPMVRPLSAGPFHRPQEELEIKPDPQRVLADSSLLPSDPAVPLIRAIKSELQKCALPGSTHNLAE